LKLLPLPPFLPFPSLSPLQPSPSLKMSPRTGQRVGLLLALTALVALGCAPRLTEAVMGSCSAPCYGAQSTLSPNLLGPLAVAGDGGWESAGLVQGLVHRPRCALLVLHSWYATPCLSLRTPAGPCASLRILACPRASLLVPNLYSSLLVPNLYSSLLVPNLYSSLLVPNLYSSLLVPNPYSSLLVPNLYSSLLVPCLTCQSLKSRCAYPCPSHPWSLRIPVGPCACLLLPALPSLSAFPRSLRFP